MTDTEIMTRGRGGEDHSWVPDTRIQLRPIDGVLIVVFLAAFVGMIFLLSR
jgi:hypothetical protein